MIEIKKRIIPLLNKLPYIRTLRNLLDDYQRQMAYPPGHYYSPIPDLLEINENKKRIFHTDEPLAINLEKKNQKILLEEMRPYFSEFKYLGKLMPGYRYFVPKSYFTYTDALSLFVMLRHLKPNKIIEIGSGYSSALILDVNENYFNNSIKFITIDPSGDRLKQLINKNDFNKFNFIKSKVQDIDLIIFDQLEENDLLFVDSTHVAKTGSDLNFILFQILPKLKKGVIIHFHDVYYPFEYPESLILEDKLAWNEAYFLRAFLMYNSVFCIYYFPGFIHKFYRQDVQDYINTELEDEGTSIYIKKIK